VFSFAGLFYKPVPAKTQPVFSRFGVFIPAYKEDGVIEDVAKKALQQNYPSTDYDVVIIADSLQPETLERLRSLPIKVVEVQFESSTKVKSINHAIAELRQSYDYIIILDADNVMYPDFISRMNNLHAQGYQAVQGQRLPKNTNTSLSFLDGLSEAINNHIYRQGTAALGLSSSISGSGVSFNYTIFKNLITGMTSIGGFDRELELLLLSDGIKVLYEKEAKVLDEKVQKTAVFENQRKRWISSQYHYLGKYFGKGMTAFFKGNFTFFNSAVLRNIQLPRLINLGLIAVMPVLLYFVKDYLAVNYFIWPTFLGIMILSMLIAIPREYYTLELVKSILKIPGLFLRMFLLLFRLKGANKKFIHTPHYNIDVKIDNNK
jgi:cellulose synthase/poly-beta-1,6-N-acetylglucosamine synthase-like glycosyltransferase